MSRSVGQISENDVLRAERCESFKAVTACRMKITVNCFVHTYKTNSLATLSITAILILYDSLSKYRWVRS